MSIETPPLRDQGLQALQAGELKKAIDLLSKAVLQDHNDAHAKVLLGMAYSQDGMHAQAIRALQTAVEIEPKNADFRYNLGAALENSGDTAGALHAYRDAIQLNKDHAAARTRLQTLGQALGAQANQILGGERPASAGAPPVEAAPQAAIPGGKREDREEAETTQCEACHKSTPIGMVCIHCLAALPPPPPPKPVSPSALRSPVSAATSKIKLPPHRANTILALGIGGFFFPPLSVAAISMGGIDLVIMERNEMDPSGRGATDLGRKLGFAGLILWGLAIVVVFVVPAILRMYKTSSIPAPARVAAIMAPHHPEPARKV